MEKVYSIGIDIGSTTVKMVVVDEAGRALATHYERHNAKIRESLGLLLKRVAERFGDLQARIRFTGSVGLGMATRFSLPFVQEVVAATIYRDRLYPAVKTLVDIGGEDAKVVFFREGRAPELRMNGNCAGGTGAFIDQMALLLHTKELGRLAEQATAVYPMASRCGVFSKTDVQNLISRNVAKADVAASILHAVAVQTVSTLSHGMTLAPPVLLCGGPFTFIPALRKAFADCLKLPETAFIRPENSHLIPAYGAALSWEEAAPVSLRGFMREVARAEMAGGLQTALPVIFKDSAEYAAWLEEKDRYRLPKGSLRAGEQHVFIGVDSGSTTTKIVVTEAGSGLLLYTYYTANDGHPIEAVRRGLTALQARCAETGTQLVVDGSCSTGYGEDLIKAAFGLDAGIVETIAHFRAARHFDPQVSFLLDIGGQDMKAVFIDKGTVTRIDINEACSSGCGSFIETFARSLGSTAADFARQAATAAHPADLGTRCTVFMNSKVKQALREGYSVADIAAGLSYSVVKNCLYKVLKLKRVPELGGHIVVQGGTMRNDSVVRAFELLTGTRIARCDCPELMGAYGCALYAAERPCRPVTLAQMLAETGFEIRARACHGCENQCRIDRYVFANGRQYYSGNRCERVFSNRGAGRAKGENMYELKNRLLFERASDASEAGGPLAETAAVGYDSAPCRPPRRIGLPRVLDMYENYPFWHALLTAAGLQPVLSAPSSYAAYEQTACYVMSDNICFPAKVVHSHIRWLERQGVERILMPYVVYEKKEKGEANSYNCPVVSGYGEVIRNTMRLAVPFDRPVVSFKDERQLTRQCTAYLATLGVPAGTARKAVQAGLRAQRAYERDIQAANRRLFERNRGRDRLTLMLAGRPYHADPLIQHKLSDIIADMGVDVLTEDLLRQEALPKAQFVGQWRFPNRILRAAQWTAAQGPDIQFAEMTSFGCGPDAFMTDEIKDILNRSGKPLTLLKIDDIDNVGSMRLRIRSLIESIRMNRRDARPLVSAVTAPPVFTKAEKKRKILMPFFTPFLSPFLPDLIRYSGYDAECLPVSDALSSEYGLQYANNEICYPATLVVGDIVKAFKSGRYDPERTAVAFTQTGGQCRATNYLPLIKKALAESGFGQVPVVSVALGSGIENHQPGFKINWFKTLPATFHTLLYGDCLSQFYHATLPREKEAGLAQRLKERYIERGCALIRAERASGLYGLIAEAAADFKAACRLDQPCPCVGIVGEIYLKYNSFAHKEIPKWLAERGIAVAPSMLTAFFTQYFVNRKVRQAARLERGYVPERVYGRLYAYVRQGQEKANAAAAAFPYFLPFGDIFEEAAAIEPVVTLNAQFGEGWLLPAEIARYVQHGIRDVISLQPFGCIANHIVSKGLEKRLKEVYPELNLLSLDFDSGVSDANIVNRLLLFIHALK